MKFELNYPLFLHGELRDHIWGGEKLSRRYGKGSGRIAESWELSCRSEAPSIVENGPLAGRALPELLGVDFPLLVKMLDAREQLSVQVHPSDQSAEGDERGKAELWYVLEAESGSRILCGLNRDLTAEELRTAALDGSIEDCLNAIPVRAGDVIYIAPGTLHALGAGILTAELQQNSDTTFRLYDYGRGRTLHLERGCAVARRSASRPEILRAPVREGLSALIRCAEFRLSELRCSAGFTHRTGVWQHLLVLEGESRLCCRGESWPLGPGASVFLPEKLGEYSIEGPCRALITEA